MSTVIARVSFKSFRCFTIGWRIAFECCVCKHSARGEAGQLFRGHEALVRDAQGRPGAEGTTCTLNERRRTVRSSGPLQTRAQKARKQNTDIADHITELRKKAKLVPQSRCKSTMITSTHAHLV